LPGDAKVAATELSDVMGGMISLSTIGQSVDFQLIRNAHLGFRLGRIEPRADHVPLFRYLLSKFTFDPDALSAALLLAETHAQWKSPKEAHSDLHVAYQRLEDLLEGTMLRNLLSLSIRAMEKHQSIDGLNDERWRHLLEDSGLGRLSTRKLAQEHSIILTLLQGTGGRKLHRVA
jgi:hypothetical protein